MRYIRSPDLTHLIGDACTIWPAPPQFSNSHSLWQQSFYSLISLSLTFLDAISKWGHSYNNISLSLSISFSIKPLRIMHIVASMNDFFISEKSWVCQPEDSSNCQILCTIFSIPNMYLFRSETSYLHPKQPLFYIKFGHNCLGCIAPIFITIFMLVMNCLSSQSMNVGYFYYTIGFISVETAGCAMGYKTPTRSGHLLNTQQILL